MSRVTYGTATTANRLIPAPFVSINKSYQKSGNGEIIGKIYSISLIGTIIAWMGSPKSDGSFHTTGGYPDNETVASNERLAAVQRKQEAIRNLFNQEGLRLEIQSADGSAPIRCYPRIISINFPDGLWYERCEYTIELECDELLGGPFSEEDTFDQYISDASESWSIETNEEHAETLGVPKTYMLSHNVSANGKRFYDATYTLVKEPWEQAKTYVLSKLGYDASLLVDAEALNLPSYYNGFNHSRGENIDKQTGSYSVTETWILASGTATENFNVRVSDSLEDPYKTVEIEGVVTGYDQTDSNLNVTISKWDNAQTKYTQVAGLMFSRAQTISGINLNIIPMTETKGINPIQGTIDYSFEYNNRPMTMIPNVKSEVISVNDNIGGQSFASIFVLGRVKGPVLQGLGTKPENKRSLNIELVVDPPTVPDRNLATIKGIFNDQKPSNNVLYAEGIENIINAVNPLNNGYSTVFQQQPQESWDAINGRYNYSCEWTFE